MTEQPPAEVERRKAICLECDKYIAERPNNGCAYETPQCQRTRRWVMRMERGDCIQGEW